METLTTYWHNVIMSDAFAARSRKLLKRLREEAMKCKECGFSIVCVEFFKRDYAAQKEGYCSEGCREVHDAIKAMEKGRAA